MPRSGHGRRGGAIAPEGRARTAGAAESWSTQQLAEFSALISSLDDELQATEKELNRVRSRIGQLEERTAQAEKGVRQAKAQAREATFNLSTIVERTKRSVATIYCGDGLGSG